MNKMKRKIILSIILIVVVIASIFFVCNFTYIKFQPILYQDETYESFKKIKGDKLFYKHLRVVLDYYRESYKVTPEGDILIKRKSGNDTELIYNYTIKALDSSWLKTHNVSTDK